MTPQEETIGPFNGRPAFERYPHDTAEHPVRLYIPVCARAEDE